MSPQSGSDRRPELFLPDFCAMGTVFTVVVVGELLAFVLTLHPGAGGHGGWRQLALTSLFIQWVALSSIALLCVARRPLERIGNVPAAILSYAAILAVLVAVSEVAYWVFIPGLVAADASTVWQFDLRPDGLSPAQPAAAPLPHREFLLRSLGIGAIVAAAALRYFYVQHQWKMRVESETEARIQALQSRIRPHFLFNSMNTIASLARSAPELAEQVTEDLAALFRVSLGDARVPRTLAQELEVCRHYLRIESQRLGERLTVRTETEALPADALLPALSLQPLVENAVYHGVERTPDGGTIRLFGARSDGRLRLSVENTVPLDAQARQREGNRMALENVRMRMDAFFAGDAAVRVAPADGRFLVELEFPYRTTEAA